MRGNPKNQVNFDGDKKSSIRTYQQHPQKQSTFSIGWDVQQKSDNLTGKVGQGTQNSFVPQYTIQSAVPKENILQSNGAQAIQNPYSNYENYTNKMKDYKPTPPVGYDDYQGQEPYGAQEYQQPYRGGYQNAIPTPEPVYNKPNPVGYKNDYQQGPQYQQGAPQYYPDEPQYMDEDPYADDPRYRNQPPVAPQGNAPYHKVASAKNKTSNIFNTDVEAKINTNQQSEGRRMTRKTEELNPKGYGNFYQTTDQGKYVGIPKATAVRPKQQPQGVFNN